MGIEIRLASEGDAVEWNNFIEKSHYGTIFHTWEWLKIAEKYSISKIFNTPIKCKLYPLMGYHGKELVTIFPLFRYKYFYYDLVTSPPRGVEIPYLGPVLKDYERQSKRESFLSDFIEEVNTFTSSNFKPLATILITSPGFFDHRPFYWNGYKSIAPLCTYEISLSPDLETIKNSFSKDVRHQISNAQTEGVEMQIGVNGVDSIYELLFMRRMEQGGTRLSSTMSPKEYISNIYAKFSQTNLKTIIAYYKGEVIGGLITVNYKDKVQAWFGQPKPQIDGVNELMTWRMIAWAKENGYKKYEIIDGPARTPQLCNFKSKFNPYLVPYFTAKKMNSKIIDLFVYARSLWF